MHEGLDPRAQRTDLAGRTCLVLGASRGIGAATARLLADAGAAVVLGSRDVDACRAIADTVVDAGGQAVAVPVDVRDEAQVSAAVAIAEERFGALHLAFNNAGVQAAPAPLHEVDPDEAQRVLDVNLFGVYRALRQEVPALLRAGGGAIVNTASVGAVVAAAGIGPYCASKHGVVGLTRSAALDYARSGIRVNAVAPGAVRTDVLTTWLSDAAELEALALATPQGRIAEPDEIAHLVVWLLSDRASFVTGAVMVADGGYTVA